MKKILSVVLAIALVITGLYPVQLANAATTTAQNEGLNLKSEEWGKYYTANPLSQFPGTIEATIRLPESTTVYRAGVILGNGRTESSTSGETGTFNFGFFKGMIPYLYVTDNSNKQGLFYLFGEHTGSGNLTSDYTCSATETARMRSVFCTNEWVHMAVVNDVTANAMHLYVNGELFWTIENTSYTGTFNMSTELVIGGDRRSGNSQALNGDIKNVALYKDARTATEVASDYTNGVKGSEDNLLAAYELGLTSDGIYPRTITDLSGNGYTLERRFITEAEKEASTPRKDYDYSMAVIGDPQIVTANTAKNNNGKVDALFKWVVDQVEERNIQFAFNMGDLTDSNTEAQWAVGVPALKQLDGAVPYSIVRGNHDYVTEYKNYIKYEDYKDRLEGSFDGTMLNTYQKFQVGDIKYMVVNLDFGIGGSDTGNSDEIIAWANKIVAANPEYNVIVPTHAYLDYDGTYLEAGESGSPSLSKTGYYRDKDGIDIWNEFTSQHSNIVMVLSGHIGTEKVVKRESTGVNGNKVVEMLVNPQTTDQYLGVCGLVTMLYFSNEGKDVQVEYYSVLRDKYYKEDSQFTFNLNVIDSNVIEAENGAVLLAYDSVNMEGEVPVSIYEDYEDYVFAGWYKSANADYENVITDLSKVTATSYAKFIPKDILNVKVQVSNDTMKTGAYAGQHAMRFISSVESLDYKAVGFKVSFDDGSGQIKTKSISTNTVYEKIKSNIEEVDYNFSPSVITTDSEYFMTAKLPVADTEDAKAKYYTVQAYIQTADGTIVYGDGRCVSVDDAAANVINITLDVELDEEKAYTVKYGTKQGTVIVLNAQDGYSNVKLVMEEDVTASLDSATKISLYEVIGEENRFVDSFVYRNYYTTHETGNASTPNADTTWYTINPYAEVFTVASSADLYGFAKLIDNATTDFAGKEIRLIRDVVINKGKAVPATGTADATWVADDGELVYEWTPIGKNWDEGVNYFEGTFDGEGNSVSGIWLDNTTNYNGFFATAGPSSIIKNFAVTNSYFKATHDYLAPIVAFARSQYLENLYSDAVLVLTYSGSSDRSCVGGIVGRYGNPSSATATTLRSIRNCWFDGNLYAEGRVVNVGGISGHLINDLNGEFLNCLYTGNIEYNYTGTSATAGVGGVYGAVINALNTRSHTFKNCLMAGKITATYPSGVTPCAGTFIGRTSIKSGGSVIENCYSICELTINGTASTTNYGSLHRAYNWSVDCTKTKAELMINSEETLTTTWLPVLANEEESAWMCHTDGNGTALGTPILKYHADLWLEKQ